MKEPEALASAHDIQGFDCGSAVMNRWLRKHALQAAAVQSAKTFVVTERNQVIGYYSLATGSAVRDELPLPLADNLPRHPVPLVVLARLAVDRQHQRQGVARGMVRDAVHRCYAIQQFAAVKTLATHALDAEAAEFYKSLGFLASPKIDRLLFWPL